MLMTWCLSLMGDRATQVRRTLGTHQGTRAWRYLGYSVTRGDAQGQPCVPFCCVAPLVWHRVTGPLLTSLYGSRTGLYGAGRVIPGNDRTP